MNTKISLPIFLFGFAINIPLVCYGVSPVLVTSVDTQDAIPTYTLPQMVSFESGADGWVAGEKYLQKMATGQILVDAPSAGSSYYGMYSPNPIAASFKLKGSQYVSTISVVLRTPSKTSFTTFDFSLRDSLTSPYKTFASATLTALVGSVSTNIINVNKTLKAGTYYLVGIVPGYAGTPVTPNDVNGWMKSTGVYNNAAGTVTNGLWSFSGSTWNLLSGSLNGYIYYAPAFSVLSTPPDNKSTVYLLLHGLDSDPTTWDLLVDKGFGGECEEFDITDVQSVGVTPGKACYRYHFGSRLVDGRVWENGDGSTFSQLGAEVAAAVLAIKEATNPEAIVIVGHSRGGLAARAFLQALPGTPSYKVGLLTIGTPHQGSPIGRLKYWLDANGYTPDDVTQKLRFIFSPSTGYLATSYSGGTIAEPYPERTAISEPIWALNDDVHAIDAVTAVIGQISSSGLMLGEDAKQVIWGQDLFDFPSWAFLLPGEFEDMRNFVMENIMPVDIFACTPNQRNTRTSIACNGDGIVPFLSQRLSDVPGFERGTRKDIYDYQLKGIPHIQETSQTKTIIKMLTEMTKTDGFVKFSPP